MLFPATTGSGVRVKATARSAIGTGAALTVVGVMAALFVETGSLVAVVALAVSSIIVPPATPAATVTTSVNVADVGAPTPPPRLASEAETVPALPAAGALAFQPGGESNETNVVFAGNVSLTVTFWAA